MIYRSLSVDNRSLFDYGVLTCYEYDTAQKKTDNLFILLISRFDLFTGVPNTIDSRLAFSGLKFETSGPKMYEDLVQTFSKSLRV